MQELNSGLAGEKNPHTVAVGGGFILSYGLADANFVTKHLNLQRIFHKCHSMSYAQDQHRFRLEPARTKFNVENIISELSI